jgi:hypothetical protein
VLPPLLYRRGLYGGKEWTMETKWRELEYEALREEIITLTEAQQSAVRFFLPAAAAVFAVPYLANKTSHALLWAFCAGGAGLMIMAMSYTLLSYVQGIYKIGSYVRTAIESRSNGELRWESFLFESQVRRKVGWPSEHVVISLGAILANIGASLGAGYVFLAATNRGIPVIVAGFFSLATLPAAYRMWRSGPERKTHADHIASVLDSLDDSSSSTGAPTSAG